jgi:hypothetical protein
MVAGMKLPKLGKRLPKIDPRTLRLRDYIAPLKAAFNGPPAHVNWVKTGAPAWPMMLNDSLGDCVCAAAGHMQEQWTTWKGQTITPGDSAILNMYEKVGGYVPGEPATDNGCNMLDALNWWKGTGIQGRRIAAYAAVNYEDRAEVKTAVELFGNLYLGIQLPLSAQGQNVWQVPVGGPSGNGAPGSWGGHCIPVVSYDPTGLIVVTWGQQLFMTWGFLNTYADEAYAVLSPDWIESSGFSPGKVDLAQLMADLAKI